MNAFDPQAEQRLRRLVELVHGLGPAPMLHLLREIATGADLESTLQRYADLPSSFVRAVGGDSFPHPVLLVMGGRP